MKYDIVKLMARRKIRWKKRWVSGDSGGRLTFRSKKAGTLENYRIYGNTETLTRSYSGSAPLSFPIVDGAVSNYRVYGQTSRNLFDEIIYNKNVADNTIIYVPMYVGNVGYVTCSTTCPKTGDSVYDGNNSRYIFFISGSVNTGATNTANGVYNGAPRTIQPSNGYVTIAYRKIESYNIRPWEYQTMLNVGSTALPYEPYGESVGELVTDRQSEHYGKYTIPITNNSETANIYLNALLTKQGNNADYIDYAEQKRYNADGTSEDVSLPALPAQSSTNSLSVGTTIQPSSVAVDVDEVVSCGDRTENLFDGIIGDDNQILNGDDGTTTNNAYALSKYIPVEPNMSYTYHFYHNMTEHRSTYSICEYDRNKNVISPLTLRWFTENRDYDIIFTTRSDTAYIRINWKKTYDEDLMLNKGSTALPYEPYGYRVPVTVSDGTDTQTIPIYLPEQIRKIGDEAEYIDYAEQKQYFADGTETDVTLPALPTLPGTNVLSVGTAVQPSRVEVKGRIKAVGQETEPEQEAAEAEQEAAEPETAEPEPETAEAEQEAAEPEQEEPEVKEDDTDDR